MGAVKVRFKEKAPNFTYAGAVHCALSPDFPHSPRRVSLDSRSTRLNYNVKQDLRALSKVLI